MPKRHKFLNSKAKVKVGGKALFNFLDVGVFVVLFYKNYYFLFIIFLCFVLSFISFLSFSECIFMFFNLNFLKSSSRNLKKFLGFGVWFFIFKILFKYLYNPPYLFCNGNKKEIKFSFSFQNKKKKTNFYKICQ